MIPPVPVQLALPKINGKKVAAYGLGGVAATSAAVKAGSELVPKRKEKVVVKSLSEVAKACGCASHSQDGTNVRRVPTPNLENHPHASKQKRVLVARHDGSKRPFQSHITKRFKFDPDKESHIIGAVLAGSAGAAAVGEPIGRKIGRDRYNAGKHVGEGFFQGPAVNRGYFKRRREEEGTNTALSGGVRKAHREGRDENSSPHVSWSQGRLSGKFASHQQLVVRVTSSAPESGKTKITAPSSRMHNSGARIGRRISVGKGEAFEDVAKANATWATVPGAATRQRAADLAYRTRGRNPEVWQRAQVMSNRMEGNAKRAQINQAKPFNPVDNSYLTAADRKREYAQVMGQKTQRGFSRGPDQAYTTPKDLTRRLGFERRTRAAGA